jgi:catechol 2,3-dioxygenase-like lactoylglutathione lyase family enzyme
MIPIRDLFEAHLTVKDLQRSMRFFGDALGLELAQVFSERKVAFYWIGRRGNCMLGLWEAGAGPQRMNLHVAFRVDLDNLLQAAGRLREANITPLDFAGEPTDEPIVFAWILRARKGQLKAARTDLIRATMQARNLGAGSMEMEARLAMAELELKSRDKNAHHDVDALLRDASKRGFGLSTAQAAKALHTSVQLRS